MAFGTMWRGIILYRAAIGFGLFSFSTLPADAQMHFGPGVRIGGHDFANRHAGSVHVERVKRLRDPLGCRPVRHGSYRRGDGTVVRGPMEICNLVARPPGRQ